MQNETMIDKIRDFIKNTDQLTFFIQSITRNEMTGMTFDMTVTAEPRSSSSSELFVAESSAMTSNLGKEKPFNMFEELSALMVDIVDALIYDWIIS